MLGSFYLFMMFKQRRQKKPAKEFIHFRGTPSLKMEKTYRASLYMPFL